MYGHKVYTRLDQFLNKHTYPVEVPEYSVLKSDLVIDNIILPPGGIPDKNTMVLSRLTIAMMIEHCNNTIPFKILEQKDIVEIYNYLGEYINQLSQFTEVDEARDYLNRARNFHHQLERSVRMVSKRDPKVAEILRRNALHDIFKPSITTG